MTRTALAAIVAAALFVCAPAMAKTYKASTSVPATHDTVTEGFDVFSRNIEKATDGEIKVKLFAGGVLLGPKAVLDGLNDRIVEFAYVITGYFPAQLPYTGGMLKEMSIIGTNVAIVAAATSELVMLNCQPCLDENLKHGHVVTGMNAYPPMVVMSKSPIATPEDFRSKKIRSGGGLWDRYLEQLGATPVNIPSTDQYEALDRNVLDATMHLAPSLKNDSLWDMVTDVTMLRLGVWRAVNGVAVNTKTWKSFTPEQRKQILVAANEARINEAFTYIRQGVDVVEEAKKRGIRFHEPEGALLENLTAFTRTETAGAAERSKTQHGVPNADELFAKMQALVDKYQAIFDEVGGDQAKFTERARQELVEKIDTTTFGVVN
ncbi:MAG: C4-dicarboxylate TRAP transporter substrate-binding protein [Pseudomonadota bacterium]|nr:C4-dicarboxylate TRAP transporter substrate-binding protein [Pseudomonadota bacterium]